MFNAQIVVRFFLMLIWWLSSRAAHVLATVICSQNRSAPHPLRAVTSALLSAAACLAPLG